MKNILLIYIISILFLSPSKANFEIKASTAILQDYLSKEILFEKMQINQFIQLHD